MAPVYLPSNLSYTSPFNNPFSFEETTYVAQRQSRVVYVPNMYDPSMDGKVYNYVSESMIKRSNTAPVIQRPIVPNTTPFKIPPFYERPDPISNPPNEPYPPFMGTTFELRTERAYSAPSESSFLPDDDFLGRLGKLSPPIKRRNGPTTSISIPSSTLFSNPPNGLLKTDPNWFKSSSVSTAPPNAPVHKYFQ